MITSSDSRQFPSASSWECIVLAYIDVAVLDLFVAASQRRDPFACLPARCNCPSTQSRQS